MSDASSNALNPFAVVCYFDLHGVCKDPRCNMQHKTAYLLSDQEKLVDIVSYAPSLVGETFDTPIETLRSKLSAFVERFIAAQPKDRVHQPMEQVARQLVKLVRTARRKAAAAGHSLPLQRCLRSALDLAPRPAYEVKRFKYMFNGELLANGTEVTSTSAGDGGDEGGSDSDNDEDA